MTTTVSAPCMEHEIDHGLDTRVCNRRPLFERLRQILSESGGSTRERRIVN